MVMPIYSYPSTTLFVDDKESFLNTFCAQLDPSIACRKFTMPHEALAYLKNHQDSRAIIKRCIRSMPNSGGNPMVCDTISVDIKTIQNEVYNPARFSEVAVVVVDYNMPTMNGLDFCRKFTGRPIKKILLSSKVSEKVAIEAMNEGVIDCYVSKNDKNVVKLINQKVKGFQRDYFKEMCLELSAFILQSPATFLTDPAFKDFFNDICVENNIVEHYLTELTGSFLLLDTDGKAMLLAVKCYEDLKIHYEFAQDNNAPETVLNDMRSGNKIPHAVIADEYFNTDVGKNWQKQLYVATEFKGKDTYYYALIKEQECPLIEHHRVCSFNQYLEQL
jgi:CheY-like chemotaxis protein